MAIVTYSCTKCIPIDRAIIDAYRALKAMDDKAQANEEYRKNRSNADHDRALADHGMYESDHSQAGDDHFYAAQDRQTAASDHTQAQADHTRAQHDHEVAQEDHDYIESLDFSEFVKKTTTDLVNYYTKSQTYTKAEVQALIAAIPGFTYEPVPVLPTASADTMWKLYLVPSSDPQAQNVKDEFITVDNGSSVNPRYTWEQIGSTAIDLSDYVTSDALADALAGLHDVKYTEQSLTAEQKAQARTNIGATAPEVFWAEFESTTFERVLEEYNAGKIVLCFYNNSPCVLSYILASGGQPTYIYFTSLTSGRDSQAVTVKNDNTWSGQKLKLERTLDRVNTIVGNESATNKYPSAKAVYDALQIFLVTYEVTAIADIQAAVAAGKTPICFKDSYVYVYIVEETNSIIFAAVNLANVRYIRITKSTNVWYNGSIILENTANKTSDIDGNKTSTSKYPSVKAVADALPVAMTDAQLDTLFDANWQ